MVQSSLGSRPECGPNRGAIRRRFATTTRWLPAISTSRVSRSSLPGPVSGLSRPMTAARTNPFINYDHPLVTIYQKDHPFDRAGFDKAISGRKISRGSPPAGRVNRRCCCPHRSGRIPRSAMHGGLRRSPHPPGAVVVWAVLLMALLATGLPLGAAGLCHISRPGLGPGAHSGARGSGVHHPWLRPACNSPVSGRCGAWSRWQVWRSLAGGWCAGPQQFGRCSARMSCTRRPRSGLFSPSSLPSASRYPDDLAPLLGRREADGVRAHQRHRPQCPTLPMTRGSPMAMSTITTTASTSLAFLFKLIPASPAKSGSTSPCRP